MTSCVPRNLGHVWTPPVNPEDSATTRLGTRTRIRRRGGALTAHQDTHHSPQRKRHPDAGSPFPVRTRYDWAMFSNSKDTAIRDTHHLRSARTGITDRHDLDTRRPPRCRHRHFSVANQQIMRASRRRHGPPTTRSEPVPHLSPTAPMEPFRDRRNGATPGSPYWSHSMTGVMAPPERQPRRPGGG